MLTKNIYTFLELRFRFPSPVLLAANLHGPGVGPELGQQPVDVNVAPRLPVDPLRHHPVTVYELNALKCGMNKILSDHVIRHSPSRNKQQDEVFKACTCYGTTESDYLLYYFTFYFSLNEWVKKLRPFDFNRGTDEDNHFLSSYRSQQIN